jgi:hypothetical protein
MLYDCETPCRAQLACHVSNNGRICTDPDRISRATGNLERAGIGWARCMLRDGGVFEQNLVVEENPV